MLERSPDVAFFLGFLGGGGAERVFINLTRSFAERGLKVDLVLSSAGGPHLEKVSPQVRIIDFKTPRLTACLPSLISYLKQEQPRGMLSTLHYANEVALLAKKLSRTPTRVVVREANNLSRDTQASTPYKRRLLPFLVRSFYPWADHIVAVSKGVAEDLSQVSGLSLERIQTIYNPTITPELQEKAKEPLDHPWFADGQPPVILGVGKLHIQKDFSMLIRAFAQVRQVREARLIILGWGPERPQLEALVQELGLENDVALPDHVLNPYAYMSRSAVFVLSSAWEGLPNVLIEAMATAVPVISTDCQSGPSEILKGGEYGWLTPVGDPQAMAEAILKVLSGNLKPIDPDWLKQFTLEVSSQRYLDILGITQD
ncbi:MAG: glycosyltransferase [Limnoraphis robusta]